MKDLTGQHVQRLQGEARLIVVRGDEAVIFEKTTGKIGVFVCLLDESKIRSYSYFSPVSADSLSTFLTGGHQKQPLTKGIRIGPMRRASQLRRIVLLRKNEQDSYFVKVEPVSGDDASWQHNGSGWVPMANLSQNAPGMVVFLKEIDPEVILPISPYYTKQGIFFLREDMEVYVETVKARFAFGRLVPAESRV